MTKNIKCNRKIIFFIIIYTIYFIRLLFLDADVKCFDFAQVQPIDGMYYNEIAIGIYKYGFLNSLKDGFDYITLANSKTYLIPSVFVALSIKIFGNNYYGLFIPYVVTGFFILILLYKILIKFVRNEIVLFLGCIAYVLDFNILMLSRSSSTPIPCMFIVMLVLYCYTNITNINLKYFLISFLSILSFCFIYMYLPFLILGVGIAVLIDLIFEKEKIKILVSYVLGVILSIIFCEIISLAFYKQHILAVIMDTLSAHGSKIDGVGAFSSVKHFIRLCLNYWSANQFRYNYFVLAMSLLSVICSAYFVIYKKNRKLVILLSIILMHYFQTIFLNNMTPSKSTITYLYFIILICYTVENIKIQRGNVKILIFTNFVLLISLILYYISAPLVMTEFKNFIYIIVGISLLFINIAIYTNNLKVLLFPSCLTLIFMITATSFYVFHNMTYIDKGIMIDVGKITNDGVVINGKGWNLYNNIYSPSDFYDHYKGKSFNDDFVLKNIKEACYKYEDLYYIGYKNEYKNTNEKLKDTPYEFESIKIYNRDYADVYNGNRKFDIELSKKKKK